VSYAAPYYQVNEYEGRKIPKESAGKFIPRFEIEVEMAMSIRERERERERARTVPSRRNLCYFHAVF
jgi:hypothetical protein